MEPNNFPAEGSYQDQKKYVESLPHSCSEKIISVATKVESANNPMQVSPAEIPEGVTYEVWKHSFFANDGIATKRHRVISKKSLEQQAESTSTDVVEIFIGGDNGKVPVLHHFKLNPETGDWTPVGKEEKTLVEYANGLEKSDAYVYSVSDESEECYNYRPAAGK